jgi:anti-sigma regulatory factor (Ser/Thr protein kinase)
MMLELRATPEEVMRAVEALQEFGRQRNIGDKDIFGLALALEECASNIVNHAYRRDPQKKFKVSIEHSRSDMVVELRDSGPEFDPTKPKLVEAVANEDDRPPGGWGIDLVNRYMDHVCYQRQNGENVLRLTKRLDQGQPPV